MWGTLKVTTSSSVRNAVSRFAILIIFKLNLKWCVIIMGVSSGGGSSSMRQIMFCLTWMLHGSSYSSKQDGNWSYVSSLFLSIVLPLQAHRPVLRLSLVPQMFLLRGLQSFVCHPPHMMKIRLLHLATKPQYNPCKCYL